MQYKGFHGPLSWVDPSNFREFKSYHRNTKELRVGHHPDFELVGDNLSQELVLGVLKNFRLVSSFSCDISRNCAENRCQRPSSTSADAKCLELAGVHIAGFHQLREIVISRVKLYFPISLSRHVIRLSPKPERTSREGIYTRIQTTSPTSYRSSDVQLYSIYRGLQSRHRNTLSKEPTGNTVTTFPDHTITAVMPPYILTGLLVAVGSPGNVQLVRLKEKKDKKRRKVREYERIHHSFSCV